MADMGSNTDPCYTCPGYHQRNFAYILKFCYQAAIVLQQFCSTTIHSPDRSTLSEHTIASSPIKVRVLPISLAVGVFPCSPLMRSFPSNPTTTNAEGSFGGGIY